MSEAPSKARDHGWAVVTRVPFPGPILLALCLAVVIWSGLAQAAGGPELLVQFGSTGSGAGRTINPRGIATDPSTGHVYVGEVTNRRVSEFTAWGQFVRAWGVGVVSGGATGTGDLVTGSTVVTSVATTGKSFLVGQEISGPGIPAGTTISALGAGTITLSQAATETATGAALTAPTGSANVPTNEQQTVTVGGAPTGGTFTLTFSTPNPSNTTATTAGIPFGASSAEVQAALEALANVGAGNVAVAGSAGGPYTVEFTGARFGDTNVNQMTANASGLTPSGTIAVKTVQEGAAAFEVCTEGCVAGSNGSGVGQFSNAIGVAVDSSADVYVVDQSNHRVEKFGSDGEFLLMFGGDVDKTTGGNVCTKAQVEGGDVCGAGTTGTAQGQFGVWKIGSFIAVAPTGGIYVGDVNRIQEFNPDGTFKAEIPLAGAGAVESLAVDPSGNLYVASEPAHFPGVRKLDPSGAVLNTFAADKTPKALATDTAGNLYMVSGEASPVIRRFDSSGTETASFGEGEFTGSTGIGTNSVGDVYVSNFTPANSYIRVYGPLPTAFEPPPTAPPTMGAEYAASVGTGSAVVKAEVNPHFFQDTTYYVQYGSVDCEVGPCIEHPVPPGSPLAGNREGPYSTGGVLLGGLTPGATYHYRFVAVSGGGTTYGADRTFRTYLPGPFALPDSRGFEMVSPVDKNSGEVAVPGGRGGLVDAGFSVKPMQGSAMGEAIFYPSFTSFGNGQGAPAASGYLSRRGSAGWFTENISPPDREGSTSDPFRGFSADLAFGAVIQKEPMLAPGAGAGFENLYLRDDAGGGFTTLTTATPRVAAGENYCVSFAGASASSDRVIFIANGALTHDAPDAPGFSLYEWSRGEGLRLVSILPDGTPAQPSGSTGFGAEGKGCEMNKRIVHNAISADGSRIFWTYQPQPVAGVPQPTQLLARLDGSETIQLDQPEGGGGAAGKGKFWGASDTGSRVFFTDPNQLTPDGTAAASGLGDLYMYDFSGAPGSRLTDLSADPTPGSDPPDVLGVLGASEDGSHVYFAARGALAAGATSGRPNLYVWQAGAPLRFVATLSPEDAQIPNLGFTRFSGLESNLSPWTDTPAEQTARVTPDGRFLAFLSVASLTGYDNVDQGTDKPDSQAYLYDAQSQKLVCASCNPSNARPVGFSELPVWITPYEQPRYLSDDGARLFFVSRDALALHDSNGRQDVYEFERVDSGSCEPANSAFNPVSDGCLFSITPGADGDESYFLDASADGRDVFVSTRQRLAPPDEDERFDVYDARAGGGFPASPPASPRCVGEGCRPAQAPPSAPFPASSGFFGEGNVKTHRCPKGGRRARRHGGRHCSKGHRHRRSRHHGVRHERNKGRKHHHRAKKRHARKGSVNP